MGQLIYARESVGLADAVLVYLEALTQHAFREGTSFMVAIQGTTDDGDVVAQSLWFSPQIPVQFRYKDYETVEIDRHFFGEMYQSVVDNGIYFLGDGPSTYEFTGGDTKGED